MYNIKLSKPFYLLVVGILVLWFLGPHIIFSASEKTDNSRRESFSKQIEARQLQVARSVERLSISDPKLKKCILSAAKERARIHPINSGGIGDVNELTMLHCRNRYIRSLEGIEGLDRLMYLDLDGNRIADIGPLRENILLKDLSLTGNPLAEIDVIGELAALESVRLPHLPNISCKTIASITDNVRTRNIKSIRCKGKKRGDSKPQQSVTQPWDLSPTRDKDSRLTDRQEAELLEYEYDMQRRID